MGQRRTPSFTRAVAGHQTHTAAGLYRAGVFHTQTRAHNASALDRLGFGFIGSRANGLHRHHARPVGGVGLVVSRGSLSQESLEGMGFWRLGFGQQIGQAHTIENF